MLMFLNFVIMLLFVFFCVAFFTLLERKVIGYMQVRKGPNKVGYLGLLQPFSDVLKLFSKEITLLSFSNLFLYWMFPLGSLLLVMLYWFLLPISFVVFNLNFGMVFFLCLISLSIYFLVGSGYFSNSKYSLIGSYRALAQTISYEVVLAMVLCCLMILFFNFNVEKENFLALLLPIFFIWVFSCLAETNRHPFDLMEAESELVSGFNTEYSGVFFSLIFLSEYMVMMFLSILSFFLFIGFLEIIGMIMFMVFFFWFRSSYPRIRYDKVMMLNWKSFLSLVLFYLFWCVCLVL